MGRICFAFRFIVCRSFYEEIMKDSPEVFHDLMVISNSSLDFRKEHNLMSEKIRDDIIRNSDNKPEYIKASLNKINEPSNIEQIEDEVVRNIKYAIYYTAISGKKVNPICILAGESKKDEYNNSTHLAGIKYVSVKTGHDARSLIREYKKLAFGQ